MNPLLRQNIANIWQKTITILRRGMNVRQRWSPGSLSVRHASYALQPFFLFILIFSTIFQVFIVFTCFLYFFLWSPQINNHTIAEKWALNNTTSWLLVGQLFTACSWSWGLCIVHMAIACNPFMSAVKKEKRNATGIHSCISACIFSEDPVFRAPVGNVKKKQMQEKSPGQFGLACLSEPLWGSKSDPAIWNENIHPWNIFE